MESREGIPFITFFCPNAVEVLRRYIEARRKGTDKIPPETLTNDSPLFVNRFGERFRFLHSINRVWNRALETASIV
ncbi:MAG: hypothetical protein GTN80_06105 [Nitrososphaeria archaeon]|nr:hypothetical protein [Nitrososphaeria archaeon]NIQ33198.1 hypothetical protein [Nitrososphaeria archaeon]